MNHFIYIPSQSHTACIRNVFNHIQKGYALVVIDETVNSGGCSAKMFLFVSIANLIFWRLLPKHNLNDQIKALCVN